MLLTLLAVYGIGLSFLNLITIGMFIGLRKRG